MHYFAYKNAFSLFLCHFVHALHSTDDAMRAKSKRERLFKVSWFIGQEQETVLDARLERADAVDEPNNEEKRVCRPEGRVI